jgi:hypothetical protein
VTNQQLQHPHHPEVKALINTHEYKSDQQAYASPAPAGSGLCGALGLAMSPAVSSSNKAEVSQSI